jgi:uncharacterized protein YndB with AHSA1/START domain
MTRGLIATASVTIHAPAAEVWAALTSPAKIEQYLLGTEVVSDWQEGSPITWRGEYEGKSFEDKGVILTLQPGRVLRYSHYSPLSGKPDTPEHYHTVTVELAPRGTSTTVRLSQDNNESEAGRDHATQFWQAMLERLKALLER